MNEMARPVRRVERLSLHPNGRAAAFPRAMVRPKPLRKKESSSAARSCAMALPSDEQAHTRPTATTEAAVGQTGSASSNCLHDTVMMTPRCRNKATTMALE
jgi:hypothetical protein